MKNDVNIEILKYKLSTGISLVLDEMGILVEIIFPDNYSDTILKIPEFVDKIDLLQSIYNDGRISISKIIFPEYIHFLDEMVMLGSKLKSVELGKVRQLGYRCFNYCTGLEDISIKEVGIINDECFLRCTSLESFDFSCVTRRVGDSAFKRCTKLKDITGFDKLSGVTFGARCFSECSALKTLVLDGICDFGHACFVDCLGLEYVEIGESVWVEDYCFDNCSNLRKVLVKSLNCFRNKITRDYARNVFMRCYNIISIEVYDCTFDSTRMEEILGVSSDKFTLHKEKYKD